MAWKDIVENPRQYGNYEVGYGRPPAKNQFQPGISGNPKGRDKGDKNIRTLMEEELNSYVTITENGRKIRLKKKVVLVKRWTNDAMQGKGKPADILLKVLAYEVKNKEQEFSSELTEPEREVYKEYFKGVDNGN